MRELQRTTPGDIAAVPREKIEPTVTPEEGNRDAQQPTSDGKGNRRRRSHNERRSNGNGGNTHRPGSTLPNTGDPDIFGDENTRTITSDDKRTPAEGQAGREGDPEF